MTSIRVAAVMKAATVTGPANNPVRFAAPARCPARARPAGEVSDITLHPDRRGVEGRLSANQFLTAACAADITVHVIAERSRFGPLILWGGRDVLARWVPDIARTPAVKARFPSRFGETRQVYRWLAFDHG